MNAVFLDTVGMIAVWDRRDQWHDAANLAYQSLIASKTALLTTEVVLFECSNAAAHKPFRKDVVFLRDWLVARNRVAEVTRTELAEAWNIYRDSSAGDPGVVDLTSFMIMRRLGITKAFTNDQHFRAAGFTPLF